jgi:hypothetical protein
MDVMKLSPRGQFTSSIYIFFFFPTRFFSLAHFFFGETFFLSFLFGPPLTPSFFGETPTYPNPPTTLLPTNPPTSFILLTSSPPTSFYIHFHHQNFQPKESLNKLQECPMKRSFNKQATRARKQEELQGGGKNGSLKISTLLFFLYYFLHSSIFSSCCKENDDSVIIIFFFYYFSL